MQPSRPSSFSFFFQRAFKRENNDDSFSLVVILLFIDMHATIWKFRDKVSRGDMLNTVSRIIRKLVATKFWKNAILPSSNVSNYATFSSFILADPTIQLSRSLFLIIIVNQFQIFFLPFKVKISLSRFFSSFFTKLFISSFFFSSFLFHFSFFFFLIQRSLTLSSSFSFVISIDRDRYALLLAILRFTMAVLASFRVSECPNYRNTYFFSFFFSYPFLFTPLRSNPRSHS